MRVLGFFVTSAIAASCVLPGYEFEEAGRGGSAPGGAGGAGGTGATGTGGGAGDGGTGAVGGGGMSATPSVEWVWSDAAAGDQRAVEIAVHADGTAFAMLELATNRPAVVRVESNGTGETSVNLFSPNAMVAGGLGVDGNGDVYGAASFVGSATVPGVLAVDGPGGEDVVLFGLKHVDLNPRFVLPLGGVGEDLAGAVAADASGGVTVCGLYSSQWNINGEQLNPMPTPSPFLFRVDAATGTSNLWKRGIPVTGDHPCDAMAATDDNGVIVVGTFGDNGSTAPDVDLDSDDTLDSTGGRDAYIAKYDAGGEYEWSLHLGGGGEVFPQSVDVRQDTVAITGYFTGDLDVYGSAGVTTRTAEGEDVFLVLFDQDALEPQLFTFGGPANQNAWGAAIAEQGNIVYLAGDFAGAIELDTFNVTGKAKDGFVARLGVGDSWLMTFGDIADDGATGVDANAQGVFVSGYVDGSVDFGTGLIETTGQDPFVLKLLPSPQ